LKVGFRSNISRLTQTTLQTRNFLTKVLIFLNPAKAFCRLLYVRTLKLFKYKQETTMQRKSFTPVFLMSLFSVTLFKVAAANAQAAPAIRAIERNGDDVVRSAPGILAALMALFTQNPVLAVAIVVIILFILGKFFSQAS
jgi:hypothetical protein